MLLSDTEFEQLKKRVADGKKFLENKWGNTDRETQEWIRLWNQLGDQLLDQYAKRGYFPYVAPHEELLASAAAKVQAAREKLLAAGIIRKTKERRVTASAKTKSNDYQLFASS